MNQSMFFSESFEHNTFFSELFPIHYHFSPSNPFLIQNSIYRIICNGVELFNGPMLWIDITRKNFGRKAYPVAKTIYEPFANTDFFYGNSLPNSAMGEGDVLNTLYNEGIFIQWGNWL